MRSVSLSAVRLLGDDGRTGLIVKFVTLERTLSSKEGKRRKRQRKQRDQSEHDGKHDDGDVRAPKRVRIGSRACAGRGGGRCYSGQGRRGVRPCRRRRRKSASWRRNGKRLVGQKVEPQNTAIVFTLSARLDGYVESVRAWAENGRLDDTRV
jgi:hypothetical protein